MKMSFMKGVVKMNERDRLTLIRQTFTYSQMVEVPNLKKWVDYWKKWKPNGTITLIEDATIALDWELRQYKINRDMDLIFQGDDMHPEEKSAWNNCIKMIYDMYVYDMPNYFENRDTVALEVLTGDKVNMRKYYKEPIWVLEDATTLLPLTIGKNMLITTMYTEINLGTLSPQAWGEAWVNNNLDKYM